MTRIVSREPDAIYVFHSCVPGQTEKLRDLGCTEGEGFGIGNIDVSIWPRTGNAALFVPIQIIFRLVHLPAAIGIKEGIVLLAFHGKSVERRLF